MSWGPLLVNLAVTAGLVAVLMLATFLYAMRTRVHAIMDTIWPLRFVLTAVWGLRLGAHIYTRNRGQGEDKRYTSITFGAPVASSPVRRAERMAPGAANRI